ncbi:MAG: EF-P beta-lysylation protein EpmB [Gammaproteobacteria bacterium]
MNSTYTHSLTRDDSCSKDEQETNLIDASDWQQEYKLSITNIDQLCDALGLKIEQLPISTQANRQFPLRVPRSYVERMQWSNPNDPLLLQVLPSHNEDKHIDGYLKDPVGDLQSIKAPGLLQKYNGRALLLATSRCAVHCRYCFRRHFPYSSQNPRHDDWEQALLELAQDESITEIILSGGDPLVLDDAILAELINKLESIKHLQRLRIHTRLPVVMPNRICKELLTWMKNTRLKVIMVLHINHAQEINNHLQVKLQELLNIHCTLLNQSVLLKNINHRAPTLIQLSEALFNAGILPYYLHLLDKVKGAAHFDVSKEEACKLMREISKHLPGYLVPKLVNEVPGKHSKSLIAF